MLVQTLILIMNKRKIIQNSNNNYLVPTKVNTQKKNKIHFQQIYSSNF